MFVITVSLIASSVLMNALRKGGYAMTEIVMMMIILMM